jgi:hypothetical protein
MIPLILAGVGAYLVGSGLMKKSTKSYKDGGKMAKGGIYSSDDRWVVTFQNQDSGKYEKVVVRANNKKNAIEIAEDESGLGSDWKYSSAEKEMSKGGYMADGGVIYLESVGTYFRPSDLATSAEKSFSNEGEIVDLADIDNEEWFNALSEKDRATIEKYKAKGGYMAQVNKMSKDELKNWLSENYGFRGVDGKGITKELKDRTIENMRKEVLSQMKYNEKNNIKYADGGYMAKGGKLVGNQKKLDLNKNGKLDAEDFKMIRENKK